MQNKTNKLITLIHKVLTPYYKHRKKVSRNPSTLGREQNKHAIIDIFMKSMEADPEVIISKVNKAEEFLIAKLGPEIRKDPAWWTLVEALINKNYEIITKIVNFWKLQKWKTYLKGITNVNVGLIYDYIAKEDGRGGNFKIPQALHPLWIKGVLSNDPQTKADGIITNLIEKHLPQSTNIEIKHTTKYLNAGVPAWHETDKIIKDYRNSHKDADNGFPDITEKEIKYNIENMNVKSAPGEDLIVIIARKKLTCTHKYPRSIFNVMVRYGTLDQHLKK